MVYKSVYTEVEVDVDLGDFETDDLLEELDSRGALPPEGNVNAKELVEKMYYLHRRHAVKQSIEHDTHPIVELNHAQRPQNTKNPEDPEKVAILACYCQDNIDG